MSEAWGRVVRAAYRLTADRGTAEELAVAAFVRQRDGRPGRAPADVRRLVLTLPSSPLRRLPSRQPARSGPGDPLLLAYLALPARERALLVLRVADGLDGPAAAAVLRLPAERARASTGRAARSRPGQPGPGVRRPSGRAPRAVAA